MTVSFRFGGYQGEKSVHTRALRLLAAALDRRLDGEAETAVTANVADHGHKAADVLAMVAKGDMDICYFQSSYLDLARVPSLRVLDLPFLFTNRERIYAQLDGDFGVRLAVDVARETPYRVLAFWDNGFRHLSNVVQPIRTPADCAGLRIRTTASAVHQEIFASFGFVPIAIDPAELPQAVADGKVDAQENPLTNFVNFGIYRHHKHVTLTSHFFGCAPLLINRARYDALPGRAREALHAAVAEITQTQREFAVGEDALCRAVIEQGGAQIVEAGEIDVAAFKAATAGVVAREAAIVGKDVMAELDA
jgi:TRAP-type C4-dicarboxylate transport system substrate-binding protein